MRSVVVFSSGFAELGEQGRAMQDRLQTAARRTGMRLLGPNCLGAVSIPENAIATFSIVSRAQHAEGRLTRHRVAERQSRQLHHAHGERSGAGISRFMTTGNECDIDIADGIGPRSRDKSHPVLLRGLP